MTVNAKIEILIPQLSSKFLKCSKLINPTLHTQMLSWPMPNWKHQLVYPNILGGSLNIFLQVQWLIHFEDPMQVLWSGNIRKFFHFLGIFLQIYKSIEFPNFLIFLVATVQKIRQTMKSSIPCWNTKYSCSYFKVFKNFLHII